MTLRVLGLRRQPLRCPFCVVRGVAGHVFFDGDSGEQIADEIHRVVVVLGQRMGLHERVEADEVDLVLVDLLSDESFEQALARSILDQLGQLQSLGRGQEQMARISSSVISWWRYAA